MHSSRDYDVLRVYLQERRLRWRLVQPLCWRLFWSLFDLHELGAKMHHRLTGPSSRILASADQRLGRVTTRVRLYNVFYWAQAPIPPPNRDHGGFTSSWPARNGRTPVGFEATYCANYKHAGIALVWKACLNSLFYYICALQSIARRSCLLLV